MVEKQRNLVWVAVIASIVVVVSLGAFTFHLIRSPATPRHVFDQATPWIIDPQRPWIDRGPRDFDYGQVLFVPAKSRYSDSRVVMPHVPSPAATIPPEQRAAQEHHEEEAP
jgi:hypothetical protein